MCATCGCSPEHDHDHDHPHDHDHHHHHHAGHDHFTPKTPALYRQLKQVDVEAQVLGKNDAEAARNRKWLHERGAVALNVVSSPGSGKTTLLERTIRDLAPRRSMLVIEGDQATSNDADRIRKAGATAIQINTGTGCHLDAKMVRGALDELDRTAQLRGSLVLIENVGNLVCPALFDLGERAKVLVASVTEGEDKPIKYPHMFKAASLVVLSKIDLLPYVPFDREKFEAYVHEVNPAATVLPVSATTGEGLADWYGWLDWKTGGAA